MDESHMDFSGQMGSADSSGNDMMDLDDWMSHQAGFDADMQSFYSDFSLDRSNMFSMPSTQRQPAAGTEKQNQHQGHVQDQPSSHWRGSQGTSNTADPRSSMYQEPAMSWDSLFTPQAGNFQDYSLTTNTNPPKDDDDDAASCDSSCEGSCPSQCGESGHGVVCDSDDCVPPELCEDQDCFAGNHACADPCTDEDCADEVCSGDTCSGDVCQGDTCRVGSMPVPGAPITDTDKAAAAALASFGGDQLPPGHQDFSHMTHMPHGSTPFGFQGHLPGAEDLSDLTTGIPFTHFNGAWPSPAEQFLASHILQYHNPEHNLTHERPCVADHPSNLVSKCSLPRFYPDNNEGMGPDAFPSQAQHDQCGFLVQDPADFTNHIFQEHRAVLTNRYLRLAQANASQPQGNMSPYFPQLHSNCTHTHNLGTAMNSSRISSGSMPPSPLTSLSIENTATATPASPATPPSAKELTPSFSGADVALKLEDHSSPGAPRIKSQAVEAVCRWILPGGTKICGQKFETEEGLHTHCKDFHLKTIQKSEGGFTCMWEGCVRDKNFPQRSKLDRHLQTHTLYKPAQCPECGQWLSAQQALIQHMRTHTGLEPWKCPWEGCTSTFKQQSALTMHLRAHTGEKPLECEICGKRFSESSNLSKHRRIHNRKGQHVCGICGKDFHRLDQLRRHLGSNHKDQPAEASKLLNKAEEEGRGRGRGAGRASRKSEEA